MDYNGDAISDQEWGAADMDYLEQMLDAESPDDDDEEARE